MTKNDFIDIEKFKLGFYALEDTTKAPIGSLRVMRNAQVTDRGGLAPRPGTQLLGTYNSNGLPIRGFFSFRKSFGSEEHLIKHYDDELEFLSKNYSSAGWNRLKNGFQVHSTTTPAEFGFVLSLVNTENEDYTMFCNRYEPYQRWSGAVAQLNGALVGGETAITVDSTLLPDVYDDQTATSNAATTLDVSSAPWAASQWVGFYVRITSGSHSGKIRAITANTTSQITFDTLGSSPGNCTFEIRKIKFPATGTLIYNGTTIAYTAVPTDATITVASAHAAPDDTVVAIVPTEYVGNPRGNRFTNFLNRIMVGNVRSALTRGTGGALQGYAAAGTVFVSKVNTPTDFGYSASRVAGEGDAISMPYGGGDITDLQSQEDAAYAFKQYYIEAIRYTQDTNDIAARESLKAGIGSVGKTVRGADDVFFITPDKQITSLGRVRTKDIKPQTLNIGFKIKRFLDTCVVDDIGRGAEINGKVYFPIKSSSQFSYNDILLVYNKQTDSFEGIWDVGAFGIERFNNKWYYAESSGANVYELFKGFADVSGDTRYPIFSEVATHFINLSASKSKTQAMWGLYVEGYIRGGTQVEFKVWKDFADEPFLTFTLTTDETGLMDGQESSAFLGSNPLAIDPMGATFSDPDADGRRHFSFRVYFPFQYGNFFSVGHSSNGADFDYEVSRYALGMKEDPVVNTARIKVI